MSTYEEMLERLGDAREKAYSWLLTNAVHDSMCSYTRDVSLGCNCIAVLNVQQFLSVMAANPNEHEGSDVLSQFMMQTLVRRSWEKVRHTTKGES